MVEANEVTGANGVIATGPAEAARIGGRIFVQGGNAIDAAAAACLACAVLEPQAVDLGGYVASGVVLDARSGQVWSIDGNSVAPAAAREDMYQVLPKRPSPRGINEIEYACSVLDDANIYGPLSVAVPGFLGGVGTMWERWGRLRWADIVAPSRALVDAGLSYDLVRESVAKKRDAIARFPDTAALLLAPERWPPPELGRTLDRLSAAGWRDFYDGELGRTIADFVIGQGGILTRADMAAFAPRVTAPCTVAWRDATIHTAIAPNGGWSVLEALGDLADYRDDHDPAYWEGMATALRSMWRRRLGNADAGASPHGTVHVAAADREGNLVSMTISQGGLFGSCLAVPGTGVILGHGMCRFDPHAGLMNSPGAGRRPLNNVCPLIIRMPGRDVAIGARGGRRIVSVVTQLAQRIVEWGASAAAASFAPRMHVLTDAPIEISANFDPAMRREFEARGHRMVTPDEVAGAAHGAEILRDSGGLRAGGNTLAVGV